MENCVDYYEHMYHIVAALGDNLIVANRAFCSRLGHRDYGLGSIFRAFFEKLLISSNFGVFAVKPAYVQ